MPRFADPETGREILVAGERLLEREGIPGLSLRAVAAEAGVSPASLVYRFGGKERLLQTICARLGQLWNGYLHIAAREGLPGLVPGDPDPDDIWGESGLRRLRCWMAVSELGRTRDDVGEAVRLFRDQQRELVAGLVAVAVGARTLNEVPADEVDRTFALVEGLWAARSTRIDPLDAGRARRLLTAHASELAEGPGTGH